jgi:hypothetical protein
LRSVFPTEEAERFLNISPESRISKIRELEQIVGGVRIYNKLCSHGGKGIEDSKDSKKKEILYRYDR